MRNDSKKSLHESVSEVMGKNVSKRTKRNQLLKLGLNPYEIAVLLNGNAWQTSDFDFSKITFGVEIECCGFTRDTLIINARQKGLSVHSENYNHTDSLSYYKIVSDASIIGENSQEVVSPVLQGNGGLQSLKTLCTALSESNARVNRSCGLHVHIGASAMSDAHYIRIVRNYQKLESLIDSFMPASRRANNSRWCRSLQGVDFSYCGTKGDVAFAMNDDRYYKVNAQAYDRHGTIEFRQHGGTTDYKKISMWVGFLAKLVEYSYTNEVGACNTIDEIPFLSNEQKQYFNNRRAELNA